MDAREKSHGIKIDLLKAREIAGSNKLIAI